MAQQLAHLHVRTHRLIVLMSKLSHCVVIVAEMEH